MVSQVVMGTIHAILLVFGFQGAGSMAGAGQETTPQQE